MAADNETVSLRERLSYWFDGVMSRGMLAKILLLVFVSFGFVLFIGFALAVILGDPAETAPQGIWESLLYVLGKGTLGSAKGSALYLGVLLFATLYSLVFTAVLIGLITGGIRTKMDDLAKGSGRVIERGHTLVLGFNQVAFSLLGELVEANRNQSQQQTIVLLDEADKMAMEDALRAKLGPPSQIAPTRIICRRGSIYDFEVLRRCAIGKSQAVIVNAVDDFDTTKAIMACSHILNTEYPESDSYCVAAIHDAANLSSAQIAGYDGKEQDRLELIPMQETLARIMVQATRQPGLSSVYTELFNFAGHEFYIVDSDPSFGLLRGMDLAEVNRHLKAAIAVGVYSPGKGVVIGPPKETVLEEGDSLILVEEDDDPLEFSVEAMGEPAGAARRPVIDSPSKILVLGSYPIIESVLREFEYYLSQGSVVLVADSQLRMEESLFEEITSILAGKGISLLFEASDVSKRRVLWKLLDAAAPDNVLISCAADGVMFDEEDERVIKQLLFLREYREASGKHFGVTSEMNLEKNRRLASAVSSDDFIVGRHFAALLMAQIAQKRENRELFQTLLSHEGFEVYMKKASWYVEVDRSIDLYSLGMAVAEKGETLIGLRLKKDGVYSDAMVNPPKCEPGKDTAIPYFLTDDDYLVVLAETMDVA